RVTRRHPLSEGSACRPLRTFSVWSRDGGRRRWQRAGPDQRHQAARLTARLGYVEWRSVNWRRPWRRRRAPGPSSKAKARCRHRSTRRAHRRLYLFKGRFAPASERLETALELAVALWLPEVLAKALNSKGCRGYHVGFLPRGRPRRWSGVV